MKGYESLGWGFESPRLHHFFLGNKRILQKVGLKTLKIILLLAVPKPPQTPPSLLLPNFCCYCHYSFASISIMKHLLLTTIAAVVLVGL